MPIQFTNKLFQTLRDFYVDVPSSYAKLMGTPIEPPELYPVAPGDYLYFSLESIAVDLYNHGIYGELQFDIHIDGSNPTNSTSTTLWTLLIWIVNHNNIKPITLGVYSGPKQPENIDLLTEPLCAELSDNRTARFKVKNCVFIFLSNYFSFSHI